MEKPELYEISEYGYPDLDEVEVVGRFDVKGTPGSVQANEADQYVPSPWVEKYGGPFGHPQLFSSWEGIDTDLPEGEYFVVRVG